MPLTHSCIGHRRSLAYDNWYWTPVQMRLRPAGQVSVPLGPAIGA